MPLKIVSETKEKDALGTYISLPTIRKMITNMMHSTYKIDRLTGMCMPWNQHFDGRGVHYSKAEIDELFAANSDGDDSKMGLRIYIAMHGESTEENFEMPKRPPHYIGQHTTILVCTKDGKDILSPGKFVTIYESKIDRGLALDEGQICPPPKCDTII